MISTTSATRGYQDYLTTTRVFNKAPQRAYDVETTSKFG